MAAIPPRPEQLWLKQLSNQVQGIVQQYACDGDDDDPGDNGDCICIADEIDDKKNDCALYWEPPCSITFGALYAPPM